MSQQVGTHNDQILIDVAGSHSILSRLLRLAVGVTVLVGVGVVAIGSWDGWPSAPLQIAQVGEPVQLAEAAAPAPKQSTPAPKQQTQAQAPKPAQIDRNGVIILIRETLLALDQANKTGNYTVLRDFGSPEFQANTAARLAEIFAQQRKDNIDLSGVAVIDPQLTLLPQIEANGMMHMAGFFPSVPTQVNFELMFAPVGGRWKLFGLSVSFGQAAPQAPQPPAPNPPESATPAKPPERPSAPKQ
jgi:hypothetical protein